MSLSIPLNPDYARACRAAAMNGETLSGFIREAMRHRANRVLGKDDQKVVEAVEAGAGLAKAS